MAGACDEYASDDFDPTPGVIWGANGRRRGRRFECSMDKAGCPQSAAKSASNSNCEKPKLSGDAQSKINRRRAAIEKVEEANPQICEERTFWKYRKILADEKSGAIEQCGTHSGSPLFMRKNATVTTVTTVNDSTDSKPKENCQNVLSQLSHPFRGDSTDSTDSDRPKASATLPEMPTAKPKQKANANADNEAYQANTENDKKGRLLT